MSLGSSLGHLFSPIIDTVGGLIVGVHSGVDKIPGLAGTGYAWALSIMAMTVLVRIAIFPLAIKQLKSMRAMAAMQPLMAEIQEKFKHDKDAKAKAQMELMKERGNPLLGCLPVFLQFPVFISVYHVLRAIAPAKDGTGFHAYHALTQHTITAMAHGDFFGTSLGAAALSKQAVLTELGTTKGTTTVVAVLLLALSSVVTFTSMKTSMKRGGTEMPAQQAQVQKLLLYGSPAMVFLFGLNVPIGVAVYWVTNNLWTLGQQSYLVHKYPMPAKPTTGAERAAEIEKKRLGTADKTSLKKGRTAAPVVETRTVGKQVRETEPVSSGAALPAGGKSPGGQVRPGNNRPSSNKRRSKGARPGGRR